MLFKDIPGHSEVKENLVRTVQEGRISHAQLFIGPEGSGKLALALAYAQFITCSARKSDDSCGTCLSCIKSAKLIHPDIHYIFPATSPKSTDSDETPVEKSLDKWRELILANPYADQTQWYEKIGMENKQGIISAKESSEIIRKLGFKPYESDYKILIMWLPEKMNPTASNKLLKLLEEPPPGTVFILITESPGEILPTVLSRTQRVNIPAFKDEDIRSYLMHKDGYSTVSIEEAISLAEGNLNRAITILSDDGQNKQLFDQFVSYMRVSFSYSIPELLEWVEEMSKSGREKQKLFLSYALRMIRENLLINAGQKDISRQVSYEKEWSETKFSPFVNDRNTGFIYEELNLAFNHIAANGNPKIVFFDAGLKIGKYLNLARSGKAGTS